AGACACVANAKADNTANAMGFLMSGVSSAGDPLEPKAFATSCCAAGAIAPEGPGATLPLLANHEVIAMTWETPEFVEVKMDAEINSYQDDFGDDREPGV